MASNGNLPRSSLARIKGNGWLRKDAAQSWNAMARAAARDGVDLSIWESSIRRTYRPLAAQHAAYRMYGPGRAAKPGTSNHGWGISVDLMSTRQRAWIDRNGAKYGWAKRWSDASHEWWHLRFNAAVWRANRSKILGPPTLRYRMSGKSVARLQALLRAKGYTSVPAKGKPGRGYFGKTTLRAVKRFQRKKGLKADGVVGPKTWRYLRR